MHKHTFLFIYIYVFKLLDIEKNVKVYRPSCLIYLGSEKREWGSCIVGRNQIWYIAFREYFKKMFFSLVQSLSSVRLCDPMNRSMPGLPVYHQLVEFTQTHVHWLSDAIEPSHPLSSPSPVFNLSQHQGLF